MIEQKRPEDVSRLLGGLEGKVIGIFAPYFGDYTGIVHEQKCYGIVIPRMEEDLHYVREMVYVPVPQALTLKVMNADIVTMSELPAERIGFFERAALEYLTTGQSAVPFTVDPTPLYAPTRR